MKKWSQLESIELRVNIHNTFWAIDIKLAIYMILNNEPITLLQLRIVATAFLFVNVFECFSAQAISVTEVCSHQGQSNSKVTWLLAENYHNWTSGYLE